MYFVYLILAVLAFIDYKENRNIILLLKILYSKTLYFINLII